MKIAQISPLYESCPPRLYGGTERIVYYLTEELLRLGHEVTLFASGDSQTSALLEAPCEQALRLNKACKDPLVYHMTMLHRVRRRAAEFDIIHFHTDYLHFPLFAECWDKTPTTLHGRLDLPDLPVVMREFSMMPLVSISDAQQAPLHERVHGQRHRQSQHRHAWRLRGGHEPHGSGEHRFRDYRPALKSRCICAKTG